MDKLAFKERLKNAQSYIPFLQGIADSLKGNDSRKDALRDDKLKKITILQDFLRNTDQKLTLNQLIKCENVVQRLHSKYEKSLHYIKVSGKDTNRSEDMDVIGPDSPPPQVIDDVEPVVIPTERRHSLSEFCDEKMNWKSDVSKKTNMGTLNTFPATHCDIQSRNYLRNATIEKSTPLKTNTRFDLGNESLKFNDSKRALSRSDNKYSTDTYVKVASLQDVLKSPPLSANDINDLLNETMDSSINKPLLGDIDTKHLKSNATDTSLQIVRHKLALVTKLNCSQREHKDNSVSHGSERLALKYNPHPRSNSQRSTTPSMSQFQESSSVQITYEDSFPKQFSHVNLLPSINYSDPRIRKTSHPPSLLSLPIVPPPVDDCYVSSSESFTQNSKGMYQRSNERKNPYHFQHSDVRSNRYSYQQNSHFFSKRNKDSDATQFESTHKFNSGERKRKHVQKEAYYKYNRFNKKHKHHERRSDREPITKRSNWKCNKTPSVESERYAASSLNIDERSSCKPNKFADNDMEKTTSMKSHTSCIVGESTLDRLYRGSSFSGCNFPKTTIPFKIPKRHSKNAKLDVQMTESNSIDPPNEIKEKDFEKCKGTLSGNSPYAKKRDIKENHNQSDTANKDIAQSSMMSANSVAEDRFKMQNDMKSNEKNTQIGVRRILKRRCTMVAIGSAPEIDKDKLNLNKSLMLEDIETKIHNKKGKIAEHLPKSDDNCTVSVQNIISGKRRTRASMNFNEVQQTRAIFGIKLVPDAKKKVDKSPSPKVSVKIKETEDMSGQEPAEVKECMDSSQSDGDGYGNTDVTQSKTEAVTIDKPEDHDLLENFVQDILKPNANVDYILNLLGKILPDEKLQLVKDIINSTSKDQVSSAHKDDDFYIEQVRTTSPESSLDWKDPKGLKKSKRRNELERLNDDIRDMFISQGVLTATGRRMCTLVTRSVSDGKGLSNISINDVQDSSRSVTNATGRVKANVDSKVRVRKINVSAKPRDDQSSSNTAHLKVNKDDLPEISTVFPEKNVNIANSQDEAAVTEPNNSKETMDEESVIQKVSDKNIKQRKNINPLWHSQSKYTKYCVVCMEKLESITSHYNLKHGEHYLSRLPLVVLTKLKEEAGSKPIFGMEYKGNTLWYYRCPFCLNHYRKSICNWREHFSLHTGEHLFECSSCKYRARCSYEIESHIKTVCTAAKVINRSETNECDTVIRAHICHLCNFLQLSRNNLEKHYISQHTCNFEVVHSFGYFLNLFNTTDVDIVDDERANMLESTVKEQAGKNMYEIHADDLDCQDSVPTSNFVSINKELAVNMPNINGSALTECKEDMNAPQMLGSIKNSATVTVVNSEEDQQSPIPDMIGKHSALRFEQSTTSAAQVDECILETDVREGENVAENAVPVKSQDTEGVEKPVENNKNDIQHCVLDDDDNWEDIEIVDLSHSNKHNKFRKNYMVPKIKTSTSNTQKNINKLKKRTKLLAVAKKPRVSEHVRLTQQNSNKSINSPESLDHHTPEVSFNPKTNQLLESSSNITNPESQGNSVALAETINECRILEQHQLYIPNGTNDKFNCSLSIKTIQNMGYSSSNGSNFKLHCIVEKCSFLFSSDSFGLDYHFLKEHADVKWSGFCNTCKEQVNPKSNEYETFPHIMEIRHMLDNHCFNIDNEVVCTKINQNPVLKLRRLSGDCLSTANNELIKANKEITEFLFSKITGNKGTQNVDIVEGNVATRLPNTEIYDNASKCLSRSTAVLSQVVEANKRSSPDPIDISESLQVGKTKTRKFLITQTIAPHNPSDQSDRDGAEVGVDIAILETSQNGGVAVNAINDKPKTVISAPYVCMGKGCKYQTRVPIAMADHLRFHERRNFSAQRDYLQCSNCQSLMENVDDFMDHINKFHKSSKPPIEQSSGKSYEPNVNDFINKPYMDQLQETINEIVSWTGIADEELYKCLVSSCAEVSNPSTFQDHVNEHISGMNSNEIANALKCPHCPAKYQRLAGIKAHMKCHARHNYFCYICMETASNPGQIMKHFADRHWQTLNLSTSVLLRKPANIYRNELIYYVAHSEPIKAGELQQFGEKLIRNWQLKKASAKTHFKPQEIYLLPIQAIFQSEKYCAECMYKTKVRTNLLRHLQMHNTKAGSDEEVTYVDPVNPMPCLNSKERHFDKMTNLASSSLNTSSGTGNNFDGKLCHVPYAYVPDAKIFTCGVKECTYLTVSDDIFRSHLTTLHSHISIYYCPFCNEEVCKRVLSVERVLQHLRYHGRKLFQCQECQYIHYMKNVVGRHIRETHPILKVNLLTHTRIAEGSGIGTVTKKPISGKQYLEFSSNSIELKETQSVQIAFSIEKDPCDSNYGDLVHQSDNRVKDIDTTPLWKRDDPKRIRHIRGILMENEEESELYRKQLADKTDNDEDNSNSIEKCGVSSESSEMMLQPRAWLLNQSSLDVYEFACHYCGYISNCNNLKKLHWATVHNIEDKSVPFLFELFAVLKCAYCLSIVGNYKKLQAHLRAVHNNAAFCAADPNSSKIECGYCQQVCANALQLQNHYLRAKHSENDYKNLSSSVLSIILQLGKSVKFVRCNACGELFADRPAFNRHAIRAHMNNSGITFNVIDDDIIYKCPSCTYTSTNEKDTLNHMVDHYTAFKTCRICKKSQTSFISYMQHCYSDHRRETSKFCTMYKKYDLTLYLIGILLIFPNGFVISKKYLQHTEYGHKNTISDVYEALCSIAKQPPIPRLSIAHLVARKFNEVNSATQKLAKKCSNISSKKISQRRNTVAAYHTEEKNDPTDINQIHSTVHDSDANRDNLPNSEILPQKPFTVISESTTDPITGSDVNRHTEQNVVFLLPAKVRKLAIVEKTVKMSLNETKKITSRRSTWKK